MPDFDSQSANGLVIVALRIRDEECRRLVINQLLNIPSDRITSTVFEFSIADWDEGLWDEEVAWLTDVLEGTRGRIFVWRFSGDRFTRFALGEG